VIVFATVCASDGFVGVTVSRSMVASACLAYVPGDIAVAGDMAELLAFSASDGFLLILLDTDQVLVDIESFLD
jgi:hypothetical protein